MTAVAPAVEPAGPPNELPYGPRLTRVLWPLHRAFGVVNRWLVVPVFRVGLGAFFSTPFTGAMMVLRTTGRKSGLPREAPLGYVIRDGAVYVCAGFGPGTNWYRNLLSEPRVEVVLPSMAFAGLAETVTDPEEWDRVYPAYAKALGVISRLVLGDVATADRARRDELRAMLPLVRIRPTGLASGPTDPGGGAWLVIQGIWLVVAVRTLSAVIRRVRRRGPATDR